MRVAFTPTAEVSIEVDLDADSVSVVSVLRRLPRGFEELRLYPSSRLLSSRASSLERGFWSLLLAAGIVAPTLSKLMQVESFQPLRGLQWRIAAASFTRLRMLYSVGVDDAKRRARELAELALRALSDASKHIERLGRLECLERVRGLKWLVGDGENRHFVFNGLQLDEDVFRLRHMLIVKSGVIERSIKPDDYAPPSKPVGLEAALLYSGERVETGSFARVRAIDEVSATDCGITIISQGESYKLRVGESRVEITMTGGVLARRFTALYLDAILWALRACNPGSSEAVKSWEVLEGPIVAWRRFYSLPLLYNVYTSGLAGEPPLATLLETSLCLDAEKASAVVEALSAIYTACCGATIRVYGGGKVYVQRRVAPRVTA